MNSPRTQLRISDMIWIANHFINNLLWPAATFSRNWNSVERAFCVEDKTENTIREIWTIFKILFIWFRIYSFIFLFLFQFSLKINFCWFILCFISEDKKKKWQIKKKFYYNDNDCFVEIMEKKGKKIFIEVLWIQRHQVFWLRHWVHL